MRPTIRLPLFVATLAALAASATTQQIKLVRDIGPGPAGAGTTFVHPLGNVVIFDADDGARGRELWRSDGTASGTFCVRDIQPGPSSSGPKAGSWYEPEVLAERGGRAYFVASGPLGIEPWVTDGTFAGTKMIEDLEPSYTYWSSYPDWMTATSLGVYFGAETDEGYELWMSVNGTAAGTFLAHDFDPDGYSWSAPQQMCAIGATLFMSVDTQSHGRELWKSAPFGGTTLVKNIAVGSIDSSTPQELTNVNGKLFFTAYELTRGRELWTSDGTTAGTFRVKDIRVGIQSSNPMVVGVLDDLLIFSADDGVHGRELWRSNGTAAGTYLLRDIHPHGSGVSSSLGKREPTNGGVLLLSANDGVHGEEPWRTDGSPWGTFLITDLHLGSASSSPDEVTWFGDRAIFVAADSHGAELWLSDGSPGSAHRMPEVVSGAGSGSPSLLRLVGLDLYFFATHPIHGRELHVLDLAPTTSSD